MPAAGVWWWCVEDIASNRLSPTPCFCGFDAMCLFTLYCSQSASSVPVPELATNQRCRFPVEIDKVARGLNFRKTFGPTVREIYTSGDSIWKWPSLLSNDIYFCFCWAEDAEKRFQSKVIHGFACYRLVDNLCFDNAFHHWTISGRSISISPISWSDWGNWLRNILERLFCTCNAL